MPIIINHSAGLDLANDSISVAYTETRNVIKNNLIDLDPMIAPHTEVSSYEVYHQPDEVDSNGEPQFQFVPIEHNGLYTDSQIIVNPGYVVYHQEDER